MLKILQIAGDSILAKDIRQGDKLVSINGETVKDKLDYHFLTSEEELELEIERDGERFVIELEKDYDDDLGLYFPEMKPALCGNDCVFCFVDQFPPGARKTLCVKDEDYRFSFLHGNFITLSNIGKAGIERILKYRLSPLYVSVHAMDKNVRNRLLGRAKDDGFAEKFRTLAEGGISMHTQIVVTPGYNDGKILEDTIVRLAEYFPQTASIAVIPVGLTKYRENLPKLRLSTGGECAEIIETVDKYRRMFKRKYKDPLVYCSDEMFLKAGKGIPAGKYYRDFPQIENGVGLIRDLLDKFNAEKPDLPAEIRPASRILTPCGVSIAPILIAEIAPILNGVDGLTVEIIPVVNDFFGETVTVSGLLTGRDILKGLQGRRGDMILLPPDCLNYDDMFLDDMTLDEFQYKAGMKTVKYNWSFGEILLDL